MYIPYRVSFSLYKYNYVCNTLLHYISTMKMYLYILIRREKSQCILCVTYILCIYYTLYIRYNSPNKRHLLYVKMMQFGFYFAQSIKMEWVRMYHRRKIWGKCFIRILSVVVVPRIYFHILYSVKCIYLYAWLYYIKLCHCIIFYIF